MTRAQLLAAVAEMVRIIDGTPGEDGLSQLMAEEVRSSIVIHHNGTIDWNCGNAASDRVCLVLAKLGRQFLSDVAGLDVDRHIAVYNMAFASLLKRAENRGDIAELRRMCAALPSERTPKNKTELASRHDLCNRVVD